MNYGMHSEPNIEVHKFYGGTVLGTCLLALVFQTFLHKYGRWSELIDLPLLVTIYFGVSRRNPVSGLFLGAGIGIAMGVFAGHIAVWLAVGIAIGVVIGWLISRK